MVQRQALHHRELVLLALILSVGLGLRLYGLNWDDGHYLHPDERFIAQVSDDRVHWPGWSDLGQLLDPDSSPINPRRDGTDGNALSFAYGTLPIYVQGVVSWLLDSLWADRLGEYERLYLVGRVLTAFADAVTIVITFLLGRRLFGSTAGLIAATLYAFLVLPIQLSHFFTVDPWLTMFVTAAILAAVRFHDNPTLGRSIALGAVIGCAFATKASVPSLLVPVLAVYGYMFLSSGRPARIISLALAGGIISLAVFTVFEPYALVRHEAFFHDIRTQARIVRGQFDVPFTRQFVGLTPGAYELRNMFYFTTGPAFVLASIAGSVYTLKRAIRDRRADLVVPLLWIAAYIPILMITEARFLRYTQPLLPTLAVLAGGMFACAFAALAGHRRIMIQGALTGVIGTTALWAFGFASIYSAEHPRIHASEWIYENIPAGSRVTAESWDDALPLPREPRRPGEYEILSLDIYGDAPPEEKVRQLYDVLRQADYVIMSSDRVYQSIDNLPWRYAVQNEYYRRLLDGQLGYRLVYDARLQPEIFGLRIDDANADESFTVYDHPRVRIFERVETLTLDQFRARLSWGIEQPWEPARYPSRQWLRLEQPASDVQISKDAEYSGMLASSGLLSTWAWILAIELIGITALPLTARIFSNSADRGALNSRLLGLLVVGWVVWIGASLDFWPARTWTVVLAVAALGSLTWVSWLRWRWPLPTRRWLVASLVLHLGVFVIFLGFRAYYPDFWQPFLGGEKPFELAYLRAVARSTEFPPYDPWFADGVINYYYYGWHIVGTLARLTGVGVSHAFQLATPTFAAMLATGVSGLAVAVSADRIGMWFRPAAAGGLAVLLVLFAGNLDPLRQLLTLDGSIETQFDFWGSTRVIDFTINEFPYFSYLWADVHPHMMNLPILALLLTLVAATIRWIPDCGDRLPFVDLSLRLGALSLVLGTALVTNAWDLPVSIGLVVVGLAYGGMLRSRRNGLMIGALALLCAGVAHLLFYPFHSAFYSVVEGIAIADEDSPLGQFLLVWGIFLGLILIVLCAQIARSRRALRRSGDFWMATIFVLAPAGLTGLVLTYRGVEISAYEYVLAVVISAILLGTGAMAIGLGRLPIQYIVPTLLLAIATGVLSGPRPSAAVAISVVAVSIPMMLRWFHRPRFALPWALVALAGAILAGVEIVYVADDLQGGPWQRMNTVFKFYLQAWLLLGVGTALLMVREFTSAIMSLRMPTANLRIAVGQFRVRERSVAHPAHLVLVPFASILLAISLIYAFVGTPVRLRQDMATTPHDLTLNGYAWMDGATITNGTGQTIEFTGDLAAIEWLNQTIGDNDVILEAAIGPYRGNGSRISSATGLPTPIGWARHQYQQRYPEAIAERTADVRAIYNSTDPAQKLDLLRRYRVRYIVVGDVERLWNTPDDPTPYASDDGLATFDVMLGDSLDLVFDQEGTKIYEVRPFPSLAPASGAVRDL